MSVSVYLCVRAERDLAVLFLTHTYTHTIYTHTSQLAHPKVRARLGLAERVDKAERTERKAAAEHAWATRTAESVSDLSES